MNRSDTEGKSASGAVVSNTVNTRLTGTRLIVARAVWLVLATLPAWDSLLPASSFPISKC